MEPRCRGLTLPAFFAIDLIEVANPRGQAGMVLASLMFGAGGREQIAVSSGVDHDF